MMEDNFQYGQLEYQRKRGHQKRKLNEEDYSLNLDNDYDKLLYKCRNK